MTSLASAGLSSTGAAGFILLASFFCPFLRVGTGKKQPNACLRRGCGKIFGVKEY
jgi:hypothetical protein